MKIANISLTVPLVDKLLRGEPIIVRSAHTNEHLDSELHIRMDLASRGEFRHVTKEDKGLDFLEKLLGRKL